MTHFRAIDRAVVISRIAQYHWHALDDDQVVGRAEAFHRPDRRIFLSVDAWHDAVFDRLAGVLRAELPRPLHTIVDEADEHLTARWQRAGFTTRRRETDYLLPTDPALTGLGLVLPPPGVTIVGVGRAREAPLRTVSSVVRAEIEATVGWQEMPAEIMPRPVLDPARYVAAAQGDHYVGLLRIGPVIRRPRIGLIAVRADARRRGVARAMLAHLLGALHASGISAASAEVTESNAPATALFESAGARRAGRTLELILTDGGDKP